MTITKKQKQIVVALGLVVAAYLAYRWYQNRQAQNQSGNSTGLGSNLNSLAPNLVAGSAGPVSGLQYYQGATNISLTEPISQSSSSNTTVTPPPVPPPTPPPHHHPWPWPPKGWHPPHWEPPPATNSRIANAIAAQEALSGVPYTPAGANTSTGAP